MMRSLITNLKIELILRKKLISTYVYFMVMAVSAFLLIYFAGGGFQGITFSLGRSAKTLLNGPITIHNSMLLISIAGLLFISPIFGQAICKDYEAKIDQIVLATPTHRIGFYLGRFLGATLVSIFIYSGIAVGYLLASLMPNMQQSLIGPTHLSYYALPYLTIIIPNSIIFGSIFFAVAAFTKRMGSVYVIGIILYLGYIFSTTYTYKIDYQILRGLIDPFGSNASSILTEYWSPLEQDTRLVTLSGALLYNRLVWLSFSLVMLILALALTQMNLQRTPKQKEDLTPEIAPRPITQEAARLTFSVAARLRLLGRQLLFECGASFKNIFFVSMALAGIIFVMITSQAVGEAYGTPTYPVTYNILAATVGSFSMFLTAILIFYTGELLWRERQHRMNQILDALPQPDWLPLVSKFLALQLIILVLLALCGLSGMVIQLAHGYTKFELDQVFKTLFIVAYPRYLILSCFFFFIHVLINNKYLGHTLCTSFLIAQLVMPLLGFNQEIYLPGLVSGAVEYSDMNGFGPFLSRVQAYQLYWGLGGLLFLIAAYLLWPYGTDSVLSLRRQLARQRLNRPLAGVWAIILVAFAAQGAYIFHNTHILTPYFSKNERQERQVYYEKTYKAEWEKRDQLQYIAADVKADIYPDEPRLKSEVFYTLQNKSKAPITQIFLQIALDSDEYTLEFDRPAERVTFEKELKLSIYTFKDAVAPGDKVRMTYRMNYTPRGFQEKARETRLVANGTFFNSSDFFPDIGYKPSRELSLDKEREKYGLAPKQRTNPIDDIEALNFTYISNSGNWIDFSATLSTNADQIAIAPGYLQKEWTEGNRRYFEYKMDRKILNFFAFISARYEVKKDSWNDVAIEVYYQKGHEYNVDTMIAASKQGLEYFSKAFGPYQHRQFRILEFPRYDDFAQAFPNTVPFSESIGFIAKVDPKNPDDFNYPFFVTAHELAHQWWGHQVTGGNVQGSTLMSETLSQYSAVMAVEKAFGKEQVEKLLRHEARFYLGGRSSEPKREWPLALNEDQAYIYYNKGIQVMYALKEVVGEEALNKAIRNFADRVRYQEPPFTTALAFVNSLKADLDPIHGPLIDELFNKVVLYDNRIQSHKVTENPDGSINVDLEILGRKIDVDDKGTQKDLDFTLDMQIAGRGPDDRILPGTHHVIKAGVNKIQLKFTQKPKSLALDPLNMWIDLNRDDNKVTF